MGRKDSKAGELTEPQVELIQKALADRGVTDRCQVCGKKTMIVAPVVSLIGVQSHLGGQVLGGKSVPSAIRICDNCGNIEMHALGALDLLDTPQFKAIEG